MLCFFERMGGFLRRLHRCRLSLSCRPTTRRTNTPHSRTRFCVGRRFGLCDAPLAPATAQRLDAAQLQAPPGASQSGGPGERLSCSEYQTPSGYPRSCSRVYAGLPRQQGRNPHIACRPPDDVSLLIHYPLYTNPGSKVPHHFRARAMASTRQSGCAGSKIARHPAARVAAQDCSPLCKSPTCRPYRGTYALVGCVFTASPLNRRLRSP